MADDESEEKKEDLEEQQQAEPADEEESSGPKKGLDDLDLDDDLADALSGEGGEVSAESAEKLDEMISEADPEFAEKLKDISAKDFEGVVIDKGAAAEEVDEAAKVPSAFKAFLQNLPKDLKNRYFLAGAIVLIMVPLAALILMGKILPRFELPYTVQMDDITKDVYSYPTDGMRVPLFDEYRIKSHTFTFPETTINLRTNDGGAAYGKFQFFLNLRDKEDEELIEKRQSEIIDMLQRVLEQVTWQDAQTPLGKEKVKKIIRHRINEFLQANVVIGVYYRSVLLER